MPADPALDAQALDAPAPAAPAPGPSIGGFALGPLVALLLGAAFLATSPILVRFADVGPVASALWRMIFALPVLWLWARLADRGAKVEIDPVTHRWAAIAGVAFAADLALCHAAYSLTSVANAVFLVNLAPVLVVLAAWPLFGERPRTLIGVGLAMSIAGGWALTADTAARPGAEPLGDVLAGLAAFAYAGYLIAMKSARQRVAAGRIMVLSTLWCAVALLPLAVLRGEVLVPSSLAGWVAVIGLGLVAHALGQGLTAVALGRLPVGPSSMVLLLQPVGTMLLAWPLLGEAPSGLQALGGALVLAAVTLARPR